MIFDYPNDDDDRFDPSHLSDSGSSPSSSTTRGGSWQVPGREYPADSLSTQLYNPPSNRPAPLDHRNRPKPEQPSTRIPLRAVSFIRSRSRSVSVSSRIRVTQSELGLRKNDTREARFRIRSGSKCGILVTSPSPSSRHNARNSRVTRPFRFRQSSTCPRVQHLSVADKRRDS